MKTYPPPQVVLFTALAGVLGIASDLSAQSWTQTPAGTTYDWNNSGNWSGTFPNAAGATANLNNNIAGAQTIRLQQAITVGTLNLGDSDGTHAFTLSTGTSGSLTFDSGSGATPAQLNLSSAGLTQNVISAPITLSSNLSVNMGGTNVTNNQGVTLSGVTTLGTNGITFTNGIFNGGISKITLGANNNNLVGSGTITNNSHSTLAISGIKTSYTGKVVIGNTASASNQAGLSMTGATSSLLNSSEFEINGFLSGGTTQNGGTVTTGNGSAAASLPGQRLSQNRITLNGGSLNNGAQTMVAGFTGNLQTETVANLDFNSGYSLVTISASATTAGSRLSITTLERSSGATGFLRSATLGGTAQISAANASGFQLGGGGSEGSTTMSIIPWLGGDNTNAGASNPAGFVTSTGNGLRALNSGEYANSITAGATANVATGAIGIVSPTTVNSLIKTSAAVENIGTGQTLTITSGALMFSVANSGIGVPGNSAAGTLNFGGAEGVVWANAAATNSIGSGILGSGGLTKAGTGTLTLTGSNSYTGETYVSAGTLIVGDGTNASNLGLTGDVGIGNGAILSLMNGATISDTATLTLENHGLFNGMLNLGSAVTETVAALYFGTELQAAGTWGASGSGATYINDTYFSGTGVLNVVPEPTTMTLLGGVGLVCLMRRRRS